MGRGIEAILITDKDGNQQRIAIHRSPVSDWSRPVWVSNVMLEDIVDTFSNDFNQSITRGLRSNKLMLVNTKYLLINNHIVKLADLYDKETYTVFVRNRNALKLVLVPAKQAKEMVAVGLDHLGKYVMPLVVTIDAGCYISLNFF